MDSLDTEWSQAVRPLSEAARPPAVNTTVSLRGRSLLLLLVLLNIICISSSSSCFVHTL